MLDWTQFKLFGGGVTDQKGKSAAKPLLGREEKSIIEAELMACPRRVDCLILRIGTQRLSYAAVKSRIGKRYASCLRSPS